MLEDNAELLAAFAEAHRSFPAAGYDRVVRDVVRWMDATLWDTDGAYFAGSQDADEHYYSLEAAERAKHGAPYVGRRLYASWNELAASAYWAAFNALGDARLDERAQAVVRTVGTRLWDREAKSLYHYDRGEGRRLPDLLGDLVASLAANLDAYETGLHPGALGGARRTALTMRERLEPARDADRIGALALPKDRVAAYVCVGTVCSAPLADEAALALAVAEAAAKVAGRA